MFVIDHYRILYAYQLVGVPVEYYLNLQDRLKFTLTFFDFKTLEAVANIFDSVQDPEFKLIETIIAIRYEFDKFDQNGNLKQTIS